jgi:phage terminase large subunit
MGFDHYCAWLDERGYHGIDWMPHDAKVREVGAPGARTRIETLALLGRKPELAPEQSLMDGINAARKTIPFARFDRERCKQGAGAAGPQARARPRAVADGRHQRRPQDHSLRPL